MSDESLKEGDRVCIVATGSVGEKGTVTKTFGEHTANVDYDDPKIIHGQELEGGLFGQNTLKEESHPACNKPEIPMS